MDVVAHEVDVAVRRGEGPQDIEQVFAAPEIMDNEPALLIEDRPAAVHFPSQFRLDDGRSDLGLDPGE